MSTMHATSEHGLYRDADRAVLGGVCAGLARYFGFNLKVTRFLAFIAFLMAMPIAVCGYLAAVFLIPSVSSGDPGVRKEAAIFSCRRRRKQRKSAVEPEPRPSEKAEVIRRRCEDLDARLARLERHVTSRRYQIEEELRRL
ncbi:MAG: PspC domain-containing protein [Gammaproteobacteria bacterium]|nr:PspC domain-containing protein [Gammaproteobacteria bacterium]